MHERRSWMVLTLAVIWLSVLCASLFAPDLVTGSEQEHVRLAAIITWLFGLAATRSVIKMMARPKDPQNETDAVWMHSGLSISAIWLLVALFAIFSPENVTGSDPTRFPIAVIVAPIAGQVLTGLVGQLFESRVQA